MTKFFGKIGYATGNVEEPVGSGIWVDKITEQEYYGEVIRNTRKLESGAGLNDDISVSNSISILADDEVIDHIHQIRYIHWAGALWTVDTVEVKSPRLILSLGSVYNGPTPVVAEPVD